MRSENFKVLSHRRYVLIQSSIECTGGSAAADKLLTLLNDFCDALDSIEGSAIFLDLNGHPEIDTSFAEQISPLAAKLKKQAKCIYLLGSSEKSGEILRTHGIAEEIRRVASLEKTLAEANLNEPQTNTPLLFDDAFIAPFIQSLQHIFRKQFNLILQMGQPFIKTKDTDFSETYRIAAAPLKTQTFEGSVCLGIDKELFLKTLKTEGPANDGLEEFLNMIFGHAKSELNMKTTHNVKMSFPQPVPDKASVEALCTSRSVFIPFQSAFGGCWLLISIED